MTAITCDHGIELIKLCADCAVASGEYRWTAAGELELIEIKTVEDLCQNPRHPSAKHWHDLHNERSYCGCSSCDAYRRER